MSQDNGGGITLHSNGEDFAVEAGSGFVPKIDPVTMKPTGEAQRFIDASQRDPLRPLRASELSSQQRNALVDSLVSAVNNHAKVLAEHRRTMEELTSAQREIHPPGSDVGLIVYDILRDTYNFYGSHAEAAVRNAHVRIVGRTFWQRLRWLVTGQ